MRRETPTPAERERSKVAPSPHEAEREEEQAREGVGPASGVATCELPGPAAEVPAEMPRDDSESPDRDFDY